MALGWGTRRKLVYSAVGVLIALVAVFFLYQTFFTAPATCFDGIQNQDERGIDCGGNSCSLVCSSEVRAPVVKWARSFETSPSTYTAAAYITNNNVGSGAKQVRYSFQLFDDKNLLIVERQGVADLPPVQTVPIVETGISVGNRSVSRTFFSFSDTPVWNRVPADAFPPLRLTNQSLNQDGTKLSASVVNDSTVDAQKVTVVAVLFDSQGVARAASKSLLGSINSKSSQNVVFTWSATTADLIRAELTVLPSF